MACILVIDDEPILLDLIANVLRLDGHSVTTASDPILAIERVKNGPELFDLVLTDVEMRPIGGFELAKRLAADKFYPPVFFMSGYPTISKTVAHASGQGAVLEKPFTAPNLRNFIRRALAKTKHKSPHNAESAVPPSRSAATRHSAK